MTYCLEIMICQRMCSNHDEHTPLLAGHPCVMSMYHMVRKKYYFPTMLPLIKQFVASCYECQSMKGKEPTPKVYYPRIPLDTRVMARISMDIKVMPKSVLGYNCILVCVCEYTNWVKAIPLVNQEAGTIADAIFFRIICEYGTPKAVICDEGPAVYFRSNENVFSCNECEAILHFTHESWIKQSRKIYQNFE